MQYDRPYNDEINIGDLFTKLREYRKYLFRKWWVILICGLVLAFLLRFYIKWRPENYVAHSDFVVKGVEGTSTSSLSSLAASFGISTTTGSEFTNELFLGIIQSHRLIAETLCQKRTCSVKGHPAREDYMANFYIEMYPRWAKKKKIDDFKLTHGNPDSLTRHEDSVLNVMYDEITDNDLTIEFSDDVGLNQLEFASISYSYSYEFATYLASAGSQYYINSQIRVEKSTVDLMQHRCDSILGALEGKENMLAKVQDNSAFTIKAQGLLTQGRLLRDITLLTTMYSTSYATMEAARFNLVSKTPLVEVIDSPQFATIKDKEQTIFYMILGLVLGCILSTAVLSIRKFVRDSVEEAKQKHALIAAEKAKANESLIDSDSNKI